jgi:hypothetical protein
MTIPGVRDLATSFVYFADTTRRPCRPTIPYPDKVIYDYAHPTTN